MERRHGTVSLEVDQCIASMNANPDPDREYIPPMLPRDTPSEP
jgi:hypothetical protein